MIGEADAPYTARFAQRSFRALVADDTFDPLVERVKAMLSGDRRMVLTHRYLHRNELRTHVGLRLDTGDRYYDEDDNETYANTRDPFRVSENRYGRGFSASLAPGIHFVAFATEGDKTERQMRAAWESRGTGSHHRPVTQVHVDGWADSPSREDRIEIEFWNEHGIGQSTLILFQADWG